MSKTKQPRTSVPLPQGIQDLRHLTQHLNMLKRQITGWHAQWQSIHYGPQGLEALHRESGAYTSKPWDTKDLIKCMRDSDLLTLQRIADQYGIRGDYTRVLPFEETRLGKRTIEREWAALPERFRLRNLPLEECQQLFKLNQDSLTAKPESERRIAELSLSEKRSLDSGS